MPKHLSKIQERGYESKSIQEVKEEGDGESGYREGEGANVNGAACLPACPPVCRPAQAPFLAAHCDTKLVVPQ